MDHLANQNQSLNLLPEVGDAGYCGRLFSPAEADNYFGILRRSIEWKHYEIFNMGRLIKTLKIPAYKERTCSYLLATLSAQDKKISLPGINLTFRTTVNFI